MDLEHFPKGHASGVVKKPLILAVDDDEDNLLLMAQILTLGDYTFVTARDGQTALTIAIEQQPDLILLDVMLPDLDGLEVVQSLRSNVTTLKTPVVAVTAMARNEDRDRLLAAGCTDYISKPYMVDELEAIIHRYLCCLPPHV
jgi:CheY-like chemotaxis protein